MCDTLVALPGATAAGATLFAKNSDRERNEAQGLHMIPAARHASGETLDVTYIAIPQAPVTHACLLSRPFWMWGAEMGANAHGVVIGNEAVHAIVPAARRRALTGMDLVRLGLERAASAAEAVSVITRLLETHGQGGDCGHLGQFYYHNSFLIADRAEAYVLETVGRWWTLERVVRARSISNALSIGAADGVSPALADHARREGWIDAAGRFDFAGRLMDRERDAVSRGVERCARSGALMAARDGSLKARDMMAILRDHGPAGAADTAWRPDDLEGRTICMHAGPGARRGQSVASLVSELGPGPAVHWVTGTSAPCLSLFKPVLFETGLPEHGPASTDRFDPEALWWRHETVHRAVLSDFAPRAAALAPERDRLEAAFAERMAAAIAADAGPAALKAEVRACWREADAALERWLKALARAAPAPRGDTPYRRSWRRLDAVAGAPRPAR